MEVFIRAHAVFLTARDTQLNLQAHLQRHVGLQAAVLARHPDRVQRAVLGFGERREGSHPRIKGLWRARLPAGPVGVLRAEAGRLRGPCGRRDHRLL